MNQQQAKLPLPIIMLLMMIGAVAIIFAFWLVEHRQVLPGSGIMLAASLGIFFLSYTGALFLYLRWRDRQRGLSVRGAAPSPSQQNLEGTIYGLVPGSQYQIIKSFIDFYGNAFEKNEILRFKQRHFLPYDGGHTVLFDERPLYLQEEKNREILENFSKYVTRITPPLNHQQDQK